MHSLPWFPDFHSVLPYDAVQIDTRERVSLTVSHDRWQMFRALKSVFRECLCCLLVCPTAALCTTLQEAGCCFRNLLFSIAKIGPEPSFPMCGPNTFQPVKVTSEGAMCKKHHYVLCEAKHCSATVDTTTFTEVE